MTFKKTSILSFCFAILLAISPHANAVPYGPSPDSGDSGPSGPVAVAGTCGTGGTAPYTSATQYTCATGTAIDPGQTGTVATWYCFVTASSSQCTSPYVAPAPVAGQCNNATIGACTVGTSGNVVDNGSTTSWQCFGLNGGTVVNCGPHADIISPGQPPSPISSTPLTYQVQTLAVNSSTAPVEPLTVGVGGVLGMTIYPGITYPVAEGGSTLEAGQVVIQKPLMFRSDTSSVSPGGSTCNALTNVGAIRWNQNSRAFEGCNGTNWNGFTNVQIRAGYWTEDGSCSDRITYATPFPTQTISVVTNRVLYASEWGHAQHAHDAQLIQGTATNTGFNACIFNHDLDTTAGDIGAYIAVGN